MPLDFFTFIRILYYQTRLLMLQGRPYAIRNAVIASLGGFLFGFDTAVISGVEKSIQQLWSLSNFWLGFTVSIALVGTIIGAISAGRPAEIYGRKRILQAIGFLYALTSLATAFSHNWVFFLIFRLLGGIGVGASSVIGPMYISESSPARLRGRLVALFQLNIVTGIFLAFLSNYLLVNLGPDAWRWMLGIQALPAVLFFILAFFIPDSPRWLMKKGREEEAGRILGRIGESGLQKEMAEIKATLLQPSGLSDEGVFQRKYRTPILCAVLLAMFNQLSGINAILYYAPRIFEMTGLKTNAAFLQSVSIGVTNMLFTVLAMFLIDRFGRKTLLIIGSFGMILFLGLASYSFFSGRQGGYFLMLCLVGFIAFFSLSQGAVIWVFISEIFPNRVRAQGQSLGSSTHWVMAAIISWAFPWVSAHLGGGVSFLFFAIMMVAQLLFVVKVLPETKGKSLEAIQAELGIA